MNDRWIVPLALNQYKMLIYTGMISTMKNSDRSLLLGNFIRSHRERVTPPSHTAANAAPQTVSRRRTPGLRREELASAAAVSVTWITWLEQGRDVAASDTALARLAQALSLTSAERATLFDLAGKRDPVTPDEPHGDLHPSILALPSLFTVPAYLLDHSWTAKAWNPAAAQLFIGWLDEKSTDRNLLKFVFLDRQAQTLIADWRDRSRRLVAEFRADYSRRPHDVAMQELIAELSNRSALFCDFWKEQSVLHREGGARSFNHPSSGMQNFVQTTLLVASHQECKLVCLAPAVPD